MPGKNKAQIQNQVFVYLIGAVITGLILFFGYKWIGDLWDKENQISLLQFQKDLTNNVDKIRPRFGSWQNLEINMPSQIDRVCFLEPSEGIDMQTQGICKINDAEYNRLMCNLWEDNAQNVITDPYVANTKIDIEKIRVDPSEKAHYICFKNMDGYIKVRLEGKGDSVLVSRW